jgi:hypothetical protein
MNPEERERVLDAVQLMQSARDTLAPVDETVVPDRNSIEECFEHAEDSLREALNRT